MHISSVDLKNFRNYKEAHCEFGDGLNILYGKNASGKTNMLESIYVSSVFRSPRTAKDKELVLIDCDRAIIKTVIQKKYCRHVLQIQIDDKGKKKVALDGIPIARAGELLGVLGTVFFSPDEMKLIKEAPQERRRFMDVGISQQQKSYFNALQRYNKTLKQKNNLLKDSWGKTNIDAMLDVWDTGLAQTGAYIVERRREYLSELNEIAGKMHAELSEDREKLELKYESSCKENTVNEEVLLKALREAREKDIQLGYCTIGAHRDDIEISINGKDSRKFASQGQQRTIALAMKLAEVEIYKRETGETPVLLLDDVLSELDATRQRILLEKTSGIQTILTCTEYKIDVSAKKFEVNDGEIKQS